MDHRRGLLTQRRSRADRDEGSLPAVLRCCGRSPAPLRSLRLGGTGVGRMLPTTAAGGTTGAMHPITGKCVALPARGESGNQLWKAIMTVTLREIPAASALGQFTSAIGAIGEETAVATWVALAESGAFFALAPESADGSRLIGVTRGGLLAAAGPDLPAEAAETVAPGTLPSAVLGRIVLDHTGCSEGTWALLHKPFLDGVEPHLRPGRELALGGELFQVLALQHVTADALAERIQRFTMSWHFLMLVGSGTTPPVVPADVAAAVSLLVVGAYDGESYFLWIRDRRVLAADDSPPGLAIRQG